MSIKTSTNWVENMTFESEIDGFKLMIDAPAADGEKSKGPRPKPFMLSALGGCTAMDVVSILKKMRVTNDIENFSVDVSGQLTEEHPKHFKSMHVQYIFKPKAGKELPLEKLQKAISLSEDRYCGVSAVYKKVMPVTSEIIIK